VDFRQANVISQWHPAFHSPYEGRNSLSPQAQDATSHVFTLYTGLRLTNNAELLCDVQETGGHGIGEAFGLAGFTNLDRCAQSHAQQGSLYRASDVASSNPPQF